jgi:hypothetical protein
MGFGGTVILIRVTTETRANSLASTQLRLRARLWLTDFQRIVETAGPQFGVGALRAGASVIAGYRRGIACPPLLGQISMKAAMSAGR